MTGARLKEVLEDVADNLFNPDPYYQQGGDMVRVGGVAYTIDVAKPMGNRISRPDPPSHRPADRCRPRNMPSPAGRASTRVREGPPIWDVVTSHIRKKRTVAPRESGRVRVVELELRAPRAP